MKENRYTMPQQFIEDVNVALKWKLYAYLNGFWIGGKTVYARNDTLAKEFSKSERAIQFALGELEELGLITRNIKGLSRFILPGGIPKEGRSPASPTHEAQLHQGDEAQLHHTSDSISDINSSVATAPQVIEVSEITEEQEKPKTPPKYPHSKEVFSWFPRPEKSWELNKTQRAHAELLYLRGEKKVKSALAFVKKHEGEDFFPSVATPYDLETKWEKLVNYKV